jgi:HK97 gp10 family phage protein
MKLRMSESINITANIEGLEELLQKLSDLGVNVRKTTTAATRYGAQAIQEQANSNAQSVSSKPGKKVALRVRFRKSGQYAVASIYPAKGHAELRLVEYGTPAGRRWSIKGKPFTFFTPSGTKVSTRMINHPGTAARPWLRPAFDAAGGKAVDRYGELLQAVIEFKQSPPNDEGDA